MIPRLAQVTLQRSTVMTESGGMGSVLKYQYTTCGLTTIQLADRCATMIRNET